MSGSNTAGVTLPIRLQANGVKEGLEAIGQAGKDAFDGIAGAAGKTEQSSAALQRAFTRTQAVLDPAAAAAEKYALQITNITRAEEAGLATAQRAAQLRDAAAAQRDRSIARIQAETAAMLSQNGALTTHAAAMQRFTAANDQAASSTRGFGGIVGQASFQVQDLVTQISMGQNALMAFGVQGAQLLGALGTGGAIAGALLVFGTLGAQMVGLGAATDTLTEATDAVTKGYDRLTDAAERRQRGMVSEAEAVGRLAEEYRGMGLAAAQAESLLVERRGAALDLEAGRMRGALQGTLSEGVERRLNPPDGSRGSEFGIGDMGLARSDEQLARLNELLELIEKQAGRTQQNMRELAAEADRLAQGGGASAESFVKLRNAALDLLPAAAQLDQAQRQIAVQTLAAAEAAGASDAAMRRYAERFGELGQGIMSAARSLNALRQQVADNPLAGMNQEIARSQAILDAIRRGGREAGERVQRQQQDQDRVTQLATRAQADFVKALEATGVAADEAQRRGEEMAATFVERAGRQVASSRAVEDGLKREAAAVREVSQEFQDLRRHTSGLLVGNTADVRNVEEIARQLRGSGIDPAARARAEAEAARTAQRAAENIERQNQQTTDSIVRYGADRFADMFSENSRGWAGMLDTFRNTFRSLMARLAAEAIIRPIIAPIVQGLGLGQLGTGGAGLGSFLGFGGSTLGGAGAVADAGGMQSGLTQAAQVAGLRQAGSFGNLGNAFTNQGAAATGYGWLDGALNTQLITPQLNSLTPVVGAPGTFLPAGAQGPVLPAALPVAEGGLSVAGAIGGAASIAGGAYGIYSGLQRGGPGGYTSAAGGALSAGLGVAMLAGATIPVAGWVLAGLLAIAGAALPGQQQSGRGQLSRINLNTANQSFEGLGGDRYSQGNRDAATNTVNSIADMARRIGDQLGGARIGGDVAVGVTSSRGNGPGQLYLQIGANTQQFSNDEQGSQQLAETAARLILEEFRRQGTAQGDYASILAASGSVEQLSQNLTWYEDVYKTLTKAKEPVSAFQQSLDAMAAQFEPAIQKARELGLSVDAMTQAREREIAKLHEQRDAQVRSFDMGLEARGQRLAGNNQWADIIEFNEQATAYLAQTRASLESLGLSAEDVASRITNAEAVLGGERLQIVQRYADEALAAETAAAAERQRLAEQTASAQVSAARTALDWLNNQALGASSSLSPTARLAEAERQFNAAMNGGDVRALTSAADALLSNSAAVYGTASAEYAQRESATRRVVLNQGNAASWGNGDQAALAAVAQLQVAFSTELASLRSAFLEMVAETRRANDKAMVA
jgi:hypothetical protein